MSEASAIIIEFRGVYAKVARKLNVSASMVSRVARGERRSPAIEEALKLEIDALRRRLCGPRSKARRSNRSILSFEETTQVLQRER